MTVNEIVSSSKMSQSSISTLILSKRMWLSDC